MLLILTLFFMGQEPRWRAALAERVSGARAFFGKLILPSLPLAGLLALAGILVQVRAVFWPLLVASTPELYTTNLVLLMMRAQYVQSWSSMAAVLLRFELPVLLFFTIALVAFHFHLDRLSLTTDHTRR